MRRLSVHLNEAALLRNIGGWLDANGWSEGFSGGPGDSLEDHTFETFTRGWWT